MAGISAQVSLYPLGRDQLGPVIDAVVKLFRGRDLRVEAGAMSTVLAGDDEVVFEALRDALRLVTAAGEAVMVATLSNACPVAQPESTSGRS